MREASSHVRAKVALMGAVCVIWSLTLSGCGPSDRSPAKGKSADEPAQTVPGEQPGQKPGAGQQVAIGAGLGFAPLTTERFDFVIPRNRIDRPAVQQFQLLLQENSTRSRLHELGLGSETAAPLTTRQQDRS